jgi:hypothetical protein
VWVPPAVLAQPAVAPVAAPSEAREVAAQAREHVVIELVWLAADAVWAIRDRWRETAPRRIDFDDDLAPKSESDRDFVLRVMSSAAAVGLQGVMGAMREAARGGAGFTAPLVLATGDVVLPFDDLEALRVTLAALAPLGVADAKIKDAVAAADALVQAGLQSGSPLVAQATAELREAVPAQARAALDAQVERVLIAEKRFQKRAVFGGPQLRLLCDLGDGEALAYLPEDAGASLPLFQRFGARIVAEAHVRQDQFEPHAQALKMLALGRIVQPW